MFKSFSFLNVFLFSFFLLIFLLFLSFFVFFRFLFNFFGSYCFVLGIFFVSDLSVSCSCSASSCGTSSFSSSSSSGWSVLGSCCCFCHCCDCLTCEGTGRLIREKTYSRVSCPDCGGSGKRRSFPFRYTPSPYPSDPYVWPKAEPIRFWTTTGAQTRGWS